MKLPAIRATAPDDLPPLYTLAELERLEQQQLLLLKDFSWRFGLVAVLVVAAILLVGLR